MKENPQEKAIRENMQAGMLTQAGFLGTDSRPLKEIILQDQAVLRAANLEQEQIAKALRRLMLAGQEGLGDPIEYQGYEIMVDEWRGKIFCPFKDQHKTGKRIVQVTRLSDQKKICYTALSIHLIDEHCFFQGQGATYRLDPQELIEFLQPLL